MRLSTVEHALQTLQRFDVACTGIQAIDVGGTRQVWLVIPRRTPPSIRERLKRRLGRLLKIDVPVTNTETIVSDNPLLARVPGIRFFDRGFNADSIATASDIEGDFLLERDVAPMLDKFDLVLSFDTLEHVSDPATFCRNLIRIARPGGYIYLATVFSWEYHPSPQDYFRFSPEGLRQCFAGSDAELLDCGWEKEGVSVYSFLRKPNESPTRTQPAASQNLSDS
jgi:SAM-dependent methyltransferase